MKRLSINELTWSMQIAKNSDLEPERKAEIVSVYETLIKSRRTIYSATRTINEVKKLWKRKEAAGLELRWVPKATV